MDVPAAFINETAYTKSLSLLNRDIDDDSSEGREYVIKAKASRSGTAKDDEFKLRLQALTSAGTMALHGGKGQDELSFESSKARKVVLDGASQVKSISIEQNGTFKAAADTSFSGFEKLEFGGRGKVTLSASAKQTIRKGTVFDVETGSGADRVTFGRIAVKGGSGTKDVTGFELDTGSGRDSIRLGDISIAKNGYVSVDAGAGNDTITLGRVSAPKGIVILEGDKGRDTYNIKAGSTAKIFLEEEGTAADTVNVSGVSASRFSTDAKVAKNLSYSLKSVMDDGRKEYCLTVRGASKSEGAGGTFSLSGTNFKGDTLNLSADGKKTLVSIDLNKVAARLKDDGTFRRLSLADVAKVTKNVSGAGAFSSVKKSAGTAASVSGTNGASLVYNADSAAVSRFLSAAAPTQASDIAAAAKTMQAAGLASVK